MIELHRAAGSHAGQELEETLRDLCVAHRVVTLPEAGDETPPPFLQEGDRRYAGVDILPFLDQLRAELTANRIISGDACYIDPRNGKVC
ncbi:MAG: hypothetical protein SH809_16300 [Rhodothermales bacterium]|nr:hypothetical protein [Rhodothermales bacterium]